MYFGEGLKACIEEVLLGIDSKDSLSETVFSWLFKCQVLVLHTVLTL